MKAAVLFLAILLCLGGFRAWHYAAPGVFTSTDAKCRAGWAWSGLSLVEERHERLVLTSGQGASFVVMPVVLAAFDEAEQSRLLGFPRERLTFQTKRCYDDTWIGMVALDFECYVPLYVDQDRDGHPCLLLDYTRTGGSVLVRGPKTLSTEELEFLPDTQMFLRNVRFLSDYWVLQELGIIVCGSLGIFGLVVSAVFLWRWIRSRSLGGSAV
jgi:hypothetical protein